MGCRRMLMNMCTICSSVVSVNWWFSKFQSLEVFAPHPGAIDMDSNVQAGSAAHQRFVKILALIVAVRLTSCAGVNVIYDPLMMFHPPWREPLFSLNERYRVPGFARSLEYDTAVFGASSAMAILRGVFSSI